MGKKEKTALARDIDLSGIKAEYDRYVKNLLSNKKILAWIVKYSMEEFKGYSIHRIEQSIEGNPIVATMSVLPDGTVKNNNQHEKIHGENVESNIPNEGKITYDIRFRIYTPTKERVNIIVNVEAQKKFSPGYNLIPRGIFYCSRMVSQQLDTEFSTDDYDNIKKVYSIWICINVPKYVANTITEYKIAQYNIVGEFPDTRKYDLMSMVMVCMGDEKNPITPLHKLLYILLSGKIDAGQKKRYIETEFDIPMTKSMEKEMSHMCNLSELIEEEALEEGMRKGMERGMQRGMIIDNLDEGVSEEIIIQKLLKRYHLSEKEAKQEIEDCRSLV